MQWRSVFKDEWEGLLWFSLCFQFPSFSSIRALNLSDVLLQMMAGRWTEARAGPLVDNALVSLAATATLSGMCVVITWPCSLMVCRFDNYGIHKNEVLSSTLFWRRLRWISFSYWQMLLEKLHHHDSISPRFIKVHQLSHILDPFWKETLIISAHLPDGFIPGTSPKSQVLSQQWNLQL